MASKDSGSKERGGKGGKWLSDRSTDRKAKSRQVSLLEKTYEERFPKSCTDLLVFRKRGSV